jgi:hypothetical protein
METLDAVGFALFAFVFGFLLSKFYTWHESMGDAKSRRVMDIPDIGYVMFKIDGVAFSRLSNSRSMDSEDLGSMYPVWADFPDEIPVSFLVCVPWDGRSHQEKFSVEASRVCGNLGYREFKILSVSSV